jgi:hypothetical protein
LNNIDIFSLKNMFSTYRRFGTEIWDVLELGRFIVGTFYGWDVLGLGMFWGLGHFGAWDILRLGTI